MAKPKKFKKSCMSENTRLGRTGEHLVCADLLSAGYDAFLIEEGLPFDVLVLYKGKLIKIQVKASKKIVNYPKSKNIYRFGTRRARSFSKPKDRVGGCGRRRFDSDTVDCFAFVALDIKRVAYFPISEMITKFDGTKLLMEFKSRRRKYKKGPFPGKFIEDYGDFSKCLKNLT